MRVDVHLLIDLHFRLSLNFYISTFFRFWTKKIPIMLATVFLHLISLILAPAFECRQPSVEKYKSGSNKDFEAAKLFLHDNDKQTSVMANKAAIAQWNYASNLTEENKKAMVIFFYYVC